jgi:hypothetical protein
MATDRVPGAESSPWAITSALANPVQACRSSMYGPAKPTWSATWAMLGGIDRAGVAV